MTKVGITPVEFEYDLRESAILTIEKEGYYPEDESLGEGWVIREYYRGNYAEGPFVISGEKKKAWKVTATRKLERVKQ